MKVFIFAFFLALVALTIATEEGPELDRSARSAVWAGRSGVWGSPVWGGYGYGAGWGRGAWGWGHQPVWGLRSSWGYPAWGGRAWGVGHGAWW